MPSSMGADFMDLAKKLKNEKLFVQNERREIEALNKKVQSLSTTLLNTSWATGLTLIQIESFSRGQPIHSGRDKSFNFIEAYKYFKNSQPFIDLINLLRSNQVVVGLFIHTFEKERHLLVKSGCEESSLEISDVLLGIVNVYGGLSGPLPDDAGLNLNLLSILAGHELTQSQAPRRILRSHSSSFSTLYRLISETLTSSRVFLVGALSQPLTSLLASSEELVEATTPTSNGGVSSADLNRDLASLDRTEKLARLIKLFIESILEHLHAFPQGLAWLIKSIHTQLIAANQSQKDANIICTDLIFALFICPAVTNPEPFGVSNAPIGTNARAVLSQVSTILQGLALYKWEGIDPRVQCFQSYFDMDSFSSVLETILSSDTSVPNTEQVISYLSRRSILIPEEQLAPLFCWIRECLVILEQNGKLTEIDNWPSLVRTSTVVNENYGNNIRSSPKINKPNTPSRPNLLNGRSSPAMFKKSSPSASMNSLVNQEQSQQNVIVFSISNEPSEWIGMLQESEVIAKKGQEELDYEHMGDECDGLVIEKRTRFSLSQDDQASVGTSDNLEAVSEAASTHSADSSIELEDNPDNLSDMLSANVSGRGTPNVSGRNTPTEEAPIENDESDDESDVVMEEPRAPEEEPRPPNINNLNIHSNFTNRNRAVPSKQARSEIEDKFCKFEIKKINPIDETVSLVSDTWSTDVLASDSEAGDRLMLPNERNTHRPSLETIEVNDTMSEAWSTDVASGDIERLHDFDADDKEDSGRVFDTPRSSVSGAGSSSAASNFRPVNNVDLLLFDEPVQMEVEAAQAPPSTSQKRDMDVGVLVPEIVTPSRSGSKSISFDKTADKRVEKDYSNSEEDNRTRRFFRNFRLPFRGSSGSRSTPSRKLRPQDEFQPIKYETEETASSDDILNKYRRKPSLTDTHQAPLIRLERKESTKATRNELISDARKKFRAVLGGCDLIGLRLPSASDTALETCMINILQCEISSAISRSDHVFAAQLQEAIRMVKILGNDGCRKTLRLLKDDYRRRCDYVSYLIRAKQGLLTAVQFLERSLSRTQHEAETYERFLVSERVRLNLEEPSNELRILNFISEFKRSLVVDEKCGILKDFLEELIGEMSRDWHPSQHSLIQNAVEQNIVGRIYKAALYPNGEVDIHRDNVLSDHISQLQAVITPTHRDLKIPKHHLAECPWPAAQQELILLSAYRTAGDKLKCVLNTCNLILNLLNVGGTVGADDLLPVLVFVLIKANPSSLLSTIQYVNSFGRLTGEDSYWWTQFASAVEFIKTME